MIKNTINKVKNDFQPNWVSRTTQDNLNSLSTNVEKYAHRFFLNYQNTTTEPRIENFRKAEKKLPHVDVTAHQTSVTKTMQISDRFLSFEMGDEILLHDLSLNSIPATCFEIGAALKILEQPGDAGKTMDHFALCLSRVFDKVYQTKLGNQIVHHNGKEKTLKQVFDEKILKEIIPGSDQIGRCTDEHLKKNWYVGEGTKWLQQQLSLPSTSSNYCHHNMLTKIRVISAFGTIIRELIAVGISHEHPLPKILDKIPENLLKRYNVLMEKLRHAEFDHSKTRARFERPPIIDGISVGNRTLQDASLLHLGFGKVYGPESFKENEQLWKRYQEVEKEKGGRQGLDREGQPILDQSRPGNISEYGLERMPQSFRDTGLSELIKQKSFDHGTGINRWQVCGTHAKHSWINGLPAAGSHSGGTVDILLALECLRDKTLLGDEDRVLQAGLLIASFMNFGGYHSFNETFPIAQAYAKGEKFKVIEPNRSSEILYTDIAESAKKYVTQSASKKIQIFRKAYDDSFKQEKSIQKVRDSSKMQIERTPSGSWEVYSHSFSKIS